MLRAVAIPRESCAAIELVDSVIQRPVSPTQKRWHRVDVVQVCERRIAELVAGFENRLC
jgi:hypothetical protein